MRTAVLVKLPSSQKFSVLTAIKISCTNNIVSVYDCGRKKVHVTVTNDLWLSNKQPINNFNVSWCRSEDNHRKRKVTFNDEETSVVEIDEDNRDYGTGDGGAVAGPSKEQDDNVEDWTVRYKEDQRIIKELMGKYDKDDSGSLDETEAQNMIAELFERNGQTMNYSSMKELMSLYD